MHLQSGAYSHNCSSRAMKYLYCGLYGPPLVYLASFITEPIRSHVTATEELRWRTVVALQILTPTWMNTHICNIRASTEYYYMIFMRS